ncbi:MAG: hypothetical protein EKK53_07875 [Burkholderiales bacterium]|nr:MAG: hypothetical protein EKK53_07875 [Burkholderiales bacterium]
MASSTTLDFVAARSPVTTPVTKFGGHPVWLQAACVPTSRRTGEPMTFIGQVVVPPELAPDERLCIAYLFMTGAGFDERAMETWSPSDGETAVVLQSGAATDARPATYPSLLTHWVDTDGPRREVACEYLVVASEANEHPYRTAESLDDLPDADRARIIESWRGNKIGGSPYWIQDEEFPFPGARLLLQLEDGTFPFNLNLGTGVGYVFLSEDSRSAALLWQC